MTQDCVTTQYCCDILNCRLRVSRTGWESIVCRKSYTQMSIVFLLKQPKWLRVQKDSVELPFFEEQQYKSALRPQTDSGQ
jgi:hypothetical protein